MFRVLTEILGTNILRGTVHDPLSLYKHQFLHLLHVLLWVTGYLDTSAGYIIIIEVFWSMDGFRELITTNKVKQINLNDIDQQNMSDATSQSSPLDSLWRRLLTSLVCFSLLADWVALLPLLDMLISRLGWFGVWRGRGTQRKLHQQSFGARGHWKSRRNVHADAEDEPFHDGVHWVHHLWTWWQTSVEVVPGEQAGWRVDAGHVVADIRRLFGPTGSAPFFSKIWDADFFRSCRTARNESRESKNKN